MKRRHVMIVLIALMALAALQRTWALRGWMLSGDDAWHTLLALQPSLRDVIVASHRWDAHPPLYYFVLRAAIALGLGGEPLLLRVPSLCAGILCIITSYGLGRAVAGGEAGGLALAGIAAFSRALMVQSQVVRQYSLMLLFLSAALMFFFSRGRHRDTGYFACALFATQVHHSASLIIVVTGLVGGAARLVAWRRSRRPGALATWCVGHLALAALVYVEVHGQTQALQAGYLAPFMGPDGSQLLLDIQNVVSGMHLGRQVVAPGLLALPFAIGLLVLVVRRRWDALAISLAPLALATTLHELSIYPMGFYGAARWYLWLVPTSLIPIAVAFQWLAERRSGRLASAIFVLALLANELTSPHARPWQPELLRTTDDWSRRSSDEEALFSLVRAHAQPGSPVVISWAEERRDELARKLGWSEHVFPHEHVTDPVVDYEIAVDHLRKSVAFANGSLVVIHIRPWDDPLMAARSLLDGCLVDVEAYVAPRDLLIAVDGDASRARLAAGCR